MNVSDSKIIFEGSAEDKTNTTCFCGLTLLQNETLFATARIASGKDTADGNVGIWQSNDLGKTWSGPQVPFETDFDGRKGCLRGGFLTELVNGVLIITCLWVDRSKGRLLYNTKTGGLCDMYPVISESHDQGKTWSVLRRVDLSPVTLPSALTGPSLVLQDGRLACQFESQKSWNTAGPIFNISTFKISDDGGLTWPGYVEIAGRPIQSQVYWDQRIAQLDDCKMINLFWTYNTVTEKDENIHISFGSENGRIWTQPADTGIKGQIACPVPLSSEHIVMLYVRRDECRQISARESFDGGKSWDESGEICIYKQDGDVVSSDNLFDAMSEWSYGHPFGVKISDNEIAVVYYAGQGQNTSLRFCRITV